MLIIGQICLSQQVKLSHGLFSLTGVPMSHWQNFHQIGLKQ